MIRRAARRDDNEPDIIRALEAAGAVVQRQEPPQPDLLTSWRGQLEQLEVKGKDLGVATRSPHRGKSNKLEGRMAWLTPAQVEWWSWWLAAGGRPPIIVLNEAEALAAIGVTTSLPADLVPDAIAVHLQRRPRIGDITPAGSGTRDGSGAPSTPSNRR